MKKVWKFILKYRIFIVILFFLVVLVFGFITVNAYLHPDDENTVYGNRLDGIDKVKISDTKMKEVTTSIDENENITSSKVWVEGRIIKISIVCSDEKNTIEKLEEILDKVVTDSFSDEEKKFYDIEIFVKNEDANYNLIGYKNKKKDTITWTSDEIVSPEGETDEEEK